MTGLVDFSIAQYAVIEARRTEGPSERFVITYPDEESLRELIAGPSIIACDFTSREEAQTNIDADFWTAAAWKETPRDRAEKYLHGVLSAKRRLGRGFDLTQTREHGSWFSPGDCGRGHSHLLFQKCRVHGNSVICCRLILVDPSSRRRPRR